MARLGVFMVVIVLVAAPARAADPLDPEQAFAHARAAFEDGDYDRAIALLQAAQSVEPRAVFVFNIARSYEEKGFLREAYDHFVLYPSLPRTTPALAADAAARASALAPLLGRAVADLRGLPPTTRAAVDGAIVPRDPLTLDPGRHTLCVLPEGGARAACWTRELAAARRVAWPPEGGERGRIALPPGAAAWLDGHPVPFTPAVSELEVDAGVHALQISPPGAPPWSPRVEVAAGATVTLEEAPPPPADPWPWVLVGVGSASVAAGAGLLIAAAVEGRPLTSPEREDGVVTGITQAEAQRLGEQVDTLVLSGSVLAGAGAALLAGGLTWWGLEDGGAAEGGAAGGTLWIAPAPGAVGLGGTF